MAQITDQRIGFIGGGHMTSNLVAGLVKQKVIEPTAIWVHDRNAHKNQHLADTHGIKIAESNEHLVQNCNLVVLSVKPQVMKAVVEPLATSFKTKQPLVISVAAGVPLNCFQRWLSPDLSVVRAMPNIASSLGLGACGLLANNNVDSKQKAVTEKIVNAVGISTWVNSDADIDSITALSGSGPAYFLLFIQELAAAAHAAGIDKIDALRFATQTALGAAQLAARNDDSLETLIAGICSKGGTTEQAVRSLQSANLSDIVADAFSAAKLRSEELSAAFTD